MAKISQEVWKNRAELVGCTWLEFPETALSKGICSCNTCLHEWSVTGGNIHQGHGCPKCARSARKKPEFIGPPSPPMGYISENEARLRLRDIHGDRITIVHYSGSNNKHSLFRCECGREWSAGLGYILSGKGCLDCWNSRRGRALRLSEVRAKEKILEVHGDGIVLKRYSGTGGTLSEFECAHCGQLWVAKVDNIANLGRGCPSCANYGYRPNKPGYFYVFLLEDDGKTFTGFGISNVPEDRLKGHYKNFDLFNIKVLRHELLGPFDGGDVARLERRFKKQVNKLETLVCDGFHTESFLGDRFDEVIAISKSQLKDQS